MNSWMSIWFSAYPYISQSIIVSAITTIAILTVIKIFAIDDPKTRIRLFITPFITPIAIPIVIQHTDYSRTYLAVGPLDGLTRTFAHLYQGGNINAGLFALICLMPILISVTKGLLSYLSIRRLVSRSLKLTRSAAPELFALLDDLVSKSEINYPQVILLDGKAPTAFTYGFYKPILAISDGLLHGLSLEELRNVLAHELVHIARRDSLLLWISKAFRDLMFYNPIVYWLAKEISREKEKACDLQACSWIGNPRSYAKTLLKIWQMALEEPFVQEKNAAFSHLPHLAKEEAFLKKRIEGLIKGPVVIQINNRPIIMAWFAFIVLELLMLKLVMVPVWASTVCSIVHLR